MVSKKKQNKAIGDLGEQLARKFLAGKGYSIVETNYWRKWGEIDVIAEREGVIHFIEVKTVSHETRQALEEAVTRGTWRPEEQVHQFKLHQIHKALETWLIDNQYTDDWQIDVVAVRLVQAEKYSKIKLIKNIIV